VHIALLGVSTVPPSVQQLSFVETKTPCTKNGQKKVVKAARAATDDLPPIKLRRTKINSNTSVAPSADSAAVAKATPKKTSPKTSAAHSADSAATAHSTKKETGPRRASKPVKKGTTISSRYDWCRCAERRHHTDSARPILRRGRPGNGHNSALAKEPSLQTGSQGLRKSGLWRGDKSRICKILCSASCG